MTVDSVRGHLSGRRGACCAAAPVLRARALTQAAGPLTSLLACQAKFFRRDQRCSHLKMHLLVADMCFLVSSLGKMCFSKASQKDAKREEDY